MHSVDVCYCWLGFSHEQLLECRNILHTAGIGKQGRSHSPSSNATAILQVHHTQQEGYSFDESIKITSKPDDS